MSESENPPEAAKRTKPRSSNPELRTPNSKHQANPRQLLVGIDLGGTTIRSGLVDRSGRVVASEDYPTRPGRGPEATLDEVSSRVREMSRRMAGDWERVIAVGIGSPGPLDLATGSIITTPNLKWDRVPLRDLLGGRIGKPVFVENDAVAATYGECWAGAGRSYSEVVGLTLGTGVGGGLVLNGRIHHGHTGLSGHVGHMVIAAGGRLCGCGNRGCLEAYASATAIVSRTREALRERPSRLNRQLGRLTALRVFEAAQEGDELGLEIFEQTAGYLAIAVNNLCNILNPQAVILMGGVSSAGDLLLQPLRRAWSQMAFPGVVESTALLRGELGEQAGLVGAAGCALAAIEASTPESELRPPNF